MIGQPSIEVDKKQVNLKLKFKAKPGKKMCFVLRRFENNDNKFYTVYKSEHIVANNDGFVEWQTVYEDTNRLADCQNGPILVEVMEYDDEGGKPQNRSEIEEEKVPLLEEKSPKTSYKRVAVAYTSLEKLIQYTQMQKVPEDNQID